MSVKFKQCMAGGARYACYQNCALEIWSNDPPEYHTALVKLDELVTEISSVYREGVILFTVVTAGTPIPGGKERKELEAFFNKWGGSWRAIARVAEGHDLWSVTARSVMTAIRLVQRTSYPARVFSEVPEGVKWTAEYMVRPEGLSTEQTARALQETVENLRAMTF